MSLINDALKRARQAQDQVAPAPSCPTLRLRDPSPPAETGRPLLLVAGTILVFGLIVFLGWQALRNHVPSNELEAKARTVAVVQSEPQSAPEQPAAEAKRAGGPPEDLAGSQRDSGPAVLGENAASEAPPLENKPAQTIARVAAPAPRLQAIIFNPANPSAIIDGKTLFVGETFGDLRLVSVTQNSVTLVGNGVTNRLSIGR